MQWVGVNQLRTSSGNAIQAGDLIDEATGSLLVKPVNAVCVPVHNATGSPLTKGMLVYISGFYYNSNYPEIAAADNTDATKQAQFVVLSDIADGADGYVNGIAMVRFMDTSARTVGDVAYLSTAGGITFTAPTTAGTMQQPVGVVASKSSSGANGDVYFFPSISRETEVGSGIDALSITTGMLANGAVTNGKLASTAVTESVTVAKTFTHASLSDSAAILGSQLSGTAAIAGTQLASKTVTYDRIADATITTSQISASAAIAGTQLASKAVTYDRIADATITTSQISASAGILGSQLGQGTEHILTGTVAFGDTTGNITGMTIPQYALVKDVFAVCTQTFVGQAYSVTIEDSGAAGGFLPAMAIGGSGLTLNNVTGANDPATRGALLWNATSPQKKYYATANAVHATITKTCTPTACSAGSLTVYCIYDQMA